MASERADFYASLDLRQVDASLKKTRENIDQSVGGHAERALSKLDGASSKAAKALGGLQFAFGGVAGGARGAMKDLGDIAMILGSGGALGIALTGGAILVGKMVEKFDLFGTRAAEAAAKAESHFTKLRDEIKNLDEELQAMITGEAIGTLRQKLLVAEKEQAARAAVEAVGGEKALARYLGYQAQGISLTREMTTATDAATAALKDYALENEKLFKMVRNRQIEELKRGEKEPAAKGVRGKAPGAGAAQFAGSEDWLADKAKWEAEQEKAHQEEIAQWMADEQLFRDLEDKKLAAFDKNEKEKTKIAKQEAAARAKVAETEAKEQAQMYAGIATAVATTTADLIAAGVTGQAAAFEAVLASASQAAGGFVMLEGAKIFAGGVAELITTAGASPHGWAMTAGGAALIGAGAAIQTGGPAAISALMGTHTGGGASGGAASTDRGAPIERRSRGSGGGSTGGGGVTIVNQWGVAGPTADDQARSLRRAIDRMNDGRF